MNSYTYNSYWPTSEKEELEAKLRHAQNEIESYKKMLVSYQNEAATAKNINKNLHDQIYYYSNQLNSMKSEGENDKKRIVDLQQQHLMLNSLKNELATKLTAAEEEITRLKSSQLQPSRSSSNFSSPNNRTPQPNRAPKRKLTPPSPSISTSNNILNNAYELAISSDSPLAFAPQTQTQTEPLPPPPFPTQPFQLETSVNTSANTSSELNVAEVVAQVRQLLKEHKMSQESFANKVLDISQGYLADLFSSNKQWNDLAKKSKMLYRKMQAWCLAKQSLNSAPSLVCQANLTDSSQSPDSLDLPYLTMHVQSLLCIFDIPDELFASQVARCDVQVLRSTLLTAKPSAKTSWAELSPIEREICMRMHAWSTCDRSINSLVALIQPAAGAAAEANEPPPLPIAELTTKVKSMLELHDIPHWVFARYVLNKPKAHLASVLSTSSSAPRAWEQLKPAEKESYRKMHAWSETEEKISALKAIRNYNNDHLLETSALNASGSATYDEANFDSSTFRFLLSAAPNESEEMLNASAISMQVRHLLKVHKISQKNFAVNTLKISSTGLCDLFYDVKPWMDLSNKQKDLYKKMHTWCLLKQSMDSVASSASKKNGGGEEDENTDNDSSGIRQTQDKLAWKNTANIIKMTRSLLCLYDIPASLFAKHVLTDLVSAERWKEILEEEPAQPWSEASESEREAYTAMFNWCLSEERIKVVRAIAQRQARANEQLHEDEESLDVEEINRTVRRLIKQNGISQFLFTKYILNKSRKTITELFKYKSEDKLSKCVVDDFRVMYLWSLSTDKVDALKAIAECFKCINT